VFQCLKVPRRDLNDLPASDKTSPDGADFCTEIAGVERVTMMEAMINDARKKGVSIHRAIATVGGSTFYNFQQLNAQDSGNSFKPLSKIFLAYP